MGIGLLKKGVIFSIRGFYRFICNHPFIVVILCFLLFLQRWFPLIFSLFLSASPILVCTALVLGALLSYGHLNMHMMQREEKKDRKSVSLKAGVSSVNNSDTEENDGYFVVTGENDAYYVDGNNEKKRDVKDESDNEGYYVVTAENDGYFVDKRDGKGQLNEQQSDTNRGYSSDDSISFIGEKSRETNLRDNRYKQKAEWSDGEALETRYATIPKVNKDNFETDDERSVDSFDSERVNVDTLDFPPISPWKRLQETEEKEENEENDNTNNNNSTAVNSESDGAESSSPDASMADMMPMLDELHPLLDEDAPQNVNMSNDGSCKSSSELSSLSSLSSHESEEETENQEDDLEVAEDEDEEGEQGEKEEEIKSTITWTEEDQKNLMDLSSSELERNQRLEKILRRRGTRCTSMVAEINLIDLEMSDHPYNIAPIVTTRQNPFDSPHDSYNNSGLPAIPGSAPSVLLKRRNPFDIHYDTIEEKQANLVENRIQEDFTTVQSREPFFRRHESFNAGPSIFAPNRPYFVPERTIPEESSYSPIQRQSSELSDSKMSSVPETESIDSVEDIEERKLIGEDSPLELEPIHTIVTEEGSTSTNHGRPIPKKEEEEVTEDELLNEPDHISKIEHVSENVGHGSQSESEEDVESYYEEGNATVETEATGYSTDSSSSLVSEVSERVLSTRPPSMENLDLRIMNAVVDIKEPVYDSSPPPVRKIMSSSSISSDVPVDSDLSERSSNIEMLPGSSTLDPVDNNESQPIDIKSVRDLDNVEDHTQVKVHNSQAESLNEMPTIPEQKILEEADEKTVGDFIVKGSVSKELEKNGDSIEGSLSATHEAETMTNTKEQVKDSRDLKKETDIHEEDAESNSKLQSHDIHIGEQIDISQNETNENDSKDSPVQSLSEDDISPKKNETSSVVDRNVDDNNHGIAETKANSSVEIDPLSKKSEVEVVTEDILEVRTTDDATLDNGQIKKDKVESSVENESTAKESSIIASEKHDDKTEGKGKSVKGKGKKSKSSSSSSSSSSDSDKD